MLSQDTPSDAGPLADPNGPWPPATPAEIPLSALEIEATGILLRNWLARHTLSHSTKTIADHPEVACHYLPELNGGIPANRIPRFLGIDVVWHCDAVPGEVHLWSAKPQNFTQAVLKRLAPAATPDDEREAVDEPERQYKSAHFIQLSEAGHLPTHGCPGCAGRMATTGNNLKLSFPEVTDYWDFEMNTYDPELYLPRSVEEGYWRDPKSGRRSRAPVVSRIPRKHIGTKSQDRVHEATKTNNLKIELPQVAARLVSSVAGARVDPRTVSPRSNRLMLWRSEEANHPDFEAQVDADVRAELSGAREGWPDYGLDRSRSGFDTAIHEHVVGPEPDSSPKHGAATERGIPVIRVHLTVEASGPNVGTVAKQLILPYWIEPALTRVMKVLPLLRKKTL